MRSCAAGAIETRICGRLEKGDGVQSAWTRLLGIVRLCRDGGLFKRVDLFVQEARDVASEAELADALAGIAGDLGFDYYALTHHIDVRHAPAPAIRLHNYPPDWARYFDENRLGPSDPVHRASHLTNVGFAWSQLAKLIKLTPRDVEILRLAGVRGIGDGFTVPAHIPGEAFGSCSFATKAGRSVPGDHLPAAQLAGAFAFEAARRLWRMRSGISPSLPLSDRQRDCVIWAARGKSDWEISRILGISQETVGQHLKEARLRYGVAKRTPLAVHALFDGTIGFIDVLRR